MTTGPAVVTGADGALGRAIAIELCAMGRRVVGLGRRQPDLDATAARAGELFLGIACDIADPAETRHAFSELRRQVGPAEILITSPVEAPRRDILDETAESFTATVVAQLGGVMACTHEALVDMVERGEGRIMHIGSLADLDPVPASSALAVATGAVRIFSRTVVADLASRFPRIVVNHWVPGDPTPRIDGSEGMDAAQMARWGAKLALMRDPSLTGSLWNGHREMVRQVPLRRRIVLRLLGRQRIGRVIT
ncbi:SDR family oxidoreductase [Rubellimicrobium arenae]|uniref:SDR family oxidoreductase n=1 Tax=Rubellimicrobium arenae TaxID=2817372 RepID=UPI001B30BA64|nr:SDR family oxidoreductase [Rubellimicrobium arenae]